MLVESLIAEIAEFSNAPTGMFEKNIFIYWNSGLGASSGIVPLALHMARAQPRL